MSVLCVTKEYFVRLLCITLVSRLSPTSVSQCVSFSNLEIFTDYFEIDFSLFRCACVVVSDGTSYSHKWTENVVKACQFSAWSQLPRRTKWAKKIVDNNLHSHWFSEERSNLSSECSELKNACDKLARLLSNKDVRVSSCWYCGWTWSSVIEDLALVTRQCYEIKKKHSPFNNQRFQLKQLKHVTLQKRRRVNQSEKNDTFAFTARKFSKVLQIPRTTVRNISRVRMKFRRNIDRAGNIPNVSAKRWPVR